MSINARSPRFRNLMIILTVVQTCLLTAVQIFFHPSARADQRGSSSQTLDNFAIPAELLPAFPGIELVKSRLAEMRALFEPETAALETLFHDCYPVRTHGANPRNLMATVSLMPGIGCKVIYFERFFQEAKQSEAQAEVTLHEALHYATRFDGKYDDSKIDDRLQEFEFEIDVKVMAHAIIQGDWERLKRPMDGWTFVSEKAITGRSADMKWLNVKEMYDKGTRPKLGNLSISGRVRQCSAYPASRGGETSTFNYRFFVKDSQTIGSYWESPDAGFAGGTFYNAQIFYFDETELLSESGYVSTGGSKNLSREVWRGYTRFRAARSGELVGRISNLWGGDRGITYYLLCP